jgi:molybdopterin-guanine dinucleotide biosynthesis protein A
MMVCANSTAGKFAAAILAGGKASRYGGAPKGLLEAAPGVSILEKTLREITAAGIKEIIILANEPGPYERFGLPIVPDIRPGIGPLGGIEAGLAHFAGRYDAVLFLPCDLPGITASEISALLSSFEAGASVVFAETGHFFEQPLCAVVHNDLLGTISRLINEGWRKVSDVWRELGAAQVRFDDPTPFFNVNTPEDMVKWRAKV